MKAKPFSPFTWPHVGRQWPEYNIWSPQAKGLVAWWPMLGDENSWPVRDLASNRFPMTPFNTPTWVNDGERGWSVLFDPGSSNYLLSASTPVVAAPLTLACWFRLDTTIGTHTFVGLYDLDGLGFSEAFMLKNLSAKLQFRVRASNSDGIAATVTDHNANTWHHACGVEYSSSNRKVFRNGGIDTGIDTNSRTPSGINTISIGRWCTIIPDYMDGRIADVRIYNRALSDTDVEDLYANPWDLYLPNTQRRWMMVVSGGTVYEQSVAGTVTPAGVLTRQIATTLAGVLTTAGALVRRAGKPLVGTLIPAGALARRTTKSFAGTLTTSSALKRAVTSLGAIIRAAEWLRPDARSVEMLTPDIEDVETLTPDIESIEEI